MKWRPLRYDHRPPEVGDIVAVNYRGLRFAPWRLASIRPLGDGRTSLVLREPDAPDLAGSDKHHIGVDRWPHPGVMTLPERYAICSCCGDLAPCRHEVEDRAVDAALTRAARFEQPGVCPACREPVTTRQQSVTLPNVVVPLGPPVTYHMRLKCRREAIDYERRVASVEGRQPRLSCAGSLVSHTTPGRDTCTNPDCPGRDVSHGSFDRRCLYRPCDQCRDAETHPRPQRQHLRRTPPHPQEESA